LNIALRPARSAAKASIIKAIVDQPAACIEQWLAACNYRRIT
jgi:hypothetical protein